MGHIWKVCPIQGPQLKDVRYEDLLNDGHFRICHTYRGGGGYDEFPKICQKRLHRKGAVQFIVQLYGCHLRCPYCYVTEAGYLGDWVPYTSQQLVSAYRRSKAQVFHLMGGSPALYIEQWPELLDCLQEGDIFHSDFLLSEKEYPERTLIDIARANCLYAVGIKGLTDSEYLKNTGRQPNWDRFRKNLFALIKCGVPFYFTYTNVNRFCTLEFERNLRKSIGPAFLQDGFHINLVQYDALTELGFDVKRAMV